MPLPWIAVLIANDRPPRRAEEPRRYAARRIPLFPTAERPALEQRARSAPQPDGVERDGRRSFLSDHLAVFSDDSQVIGAKPQINRCEPAGSWELFVAIGR